MALLGRYSAGFLSSVDRALEVRVENRWQSGADWLRAVEGEAVGEAPRKADEEAGQKPDEGVEFGTALAHHRRWLPGFGGDLGGQQQIGRAHV